jgi:hypothetical protein
MSGKDLQLTDKKRKKHHFRSKRPIGYMAEVAAETIEM